MVNVGDLLFTSWAGASALCVVFGAWRFARRMATSSPRKRVYLALAASPIVLVGAWLGYFAGTGDGPGWGILVIGLLWIVMLCCLVGLVLAIPENTRAAFGTIGFEIAAILCIGVILGALQGKLAQ
jgi:hypothetical protein